MIVVAVANTKGGVGKTTLTASLAVRAAEDSDRVAMVDLDPQSSLVAWWQRRGESEHPTMLQGVDNAYEAIERLQQTGWDYVFIDSPPAFLTVIQEAIEAADFVLIPIKPGMLDALATQDAVVLAQDAGTPFMAVLNDVTISDRRLAETWRASLFAHDIRMADTVVIHRISHIKGMSVGKTCAEVDAGKDKKAATEIDALWNEIRAATATARKKPRAVTHG